MKSTVACFDGKGCNAAVAVKHVLEFTARKPPFNVEAQRTSNSSLERPAGQQVQEAGNVLSGMPSPTSSVPVAPRQQPWPRTPGVFLAARADRFIAKR